LRADHGNGTDICHLRFDLVHPYQNPSRA
jgi:hypothetical protein